MSVTKPIILTSTALVLLLVAGCKGEKHIVEMEGTAMTDKDEKGAGAQDEVAVEEVKTQFKAWERVEGQLAKLKQVKLKWNKALLEDTQKEMLRKLIEAAGVMDELFLRQVALRNTQIRADLDVTTDPKAEVIKHYFNINFGPYDRLEKMRPFINVPYRFPGATFYPMNMKKDEFNKWIEEHPKDKKAFESNFTVITRDAGGGLKAVSYSEHYKEHLEKAAQLLKEAAALSESKSLARFLRSRAKAFLSNDYYASDLDWMDVEDNLIDVTIGPYETYEDALFGYKAAFEAFICLKDPEASEKLGTIKGFIPEMEAALPMDEEYKKAGAKKETPIVVVDVIFTAGDAKAGIQSIAFNLPNDERVRDKKGSKKVMLRNLINAKYEGILVPISKKVIHPEQQAGIDEDEFFNHVLLHEISHGIGPGFITKEGGEKTEVRLELKETYSTIEETKADVLGMTNSVFLQDKEFYPEGTDRKMWVTFLASVFRSIRFGIDEAHGKANVIILNYILEKGGYAYDAGTGTFKVNFDKVGAAATDLARELLTIEAKGDYEGARNLIEKYGVLTDVQEGVIAKLEGIPVDIEPLFDLDF